MSIEARGDDVRPEDLPPLPLARRPHDRIHERRVEQAWLDEAWAAPGTRVLVLAGSRFRLVGGRLDWVAPAAAPDGVLVLLGERDGQTRFAVVADRSFGDGEEWVGLRAALPGVGDDDAALLVHAVGIAEWLQVTRFCPRCGGDLVPRKAGHELSCTNCGRPQFPRTDAAVIMVVVDGEQPHDRVLLGRSPAWPEGRFSTLAGFVEPGESMEQAVRREVLEEVGVRVGAVRYFGSQPWPMPASLMVGFIARADSTEVQVDGNEIEDARWFTRDEILTKAQSGELRLPGGASISHALVEWWYGAPLPGSWA